MEEAFDKLLKSDEFKCSRCFKSLSLTPILLVEDNIFCGRCKDSVYEENTDPKLERQVLYEIMAENLQFPCRYQSDGCQTILRWHEVEEHESNCECGKMECFFNLSKGEDFCTWKGNHRDYLEHVEENHRKIISEIDILDIWENPRNQVFTVLLRDDILLVLLLYVDDVYYLVVIGDDKKQQVQYNIEITDEKRKKSNGFSRVSSFLPCDMKKIKEHGIKLENTNLNLKYLLFYFGEKNRCLGKCDAKTPSLCGECKKVISLPVYTCSNNHRPCVNCLGPDKKCNVQDEAKIACGQPLTENSILEMQLLKDHYRCPYKDCYFHSNFFEMRSHTKICGRYFSEFSIEKFNHPLEIASGRVVHFQFNHNYFMLNIKNSVDSLEFKLYPYEISKIEYEFEITLFNSLSNVLSFPIFCTLEDNFGKSINDKKRTVIPKNLINHDGTGKFKFKLKVSKI